MGSPTLDDPDFHAARLPASPEQPADCRACKQELRLRREAGAVTAAAAMEEHLSPWAKPRDDVLEIRHRAGRRAQHRWIEHAAACGEEAERDEAAADLEAPVGNVLMRHPVAGNVERCAEQEREPTRAEKRAGRAPDRDMQRHDHRWG
jgi:hypothetical protein